MLGIFGKDKISKVSFKKTLQIAGIPIVTLKHDNLRLNFIIDTGATTSLINSSLLERIKDKQKIDSIDVVSGLDPNVEYKTEKYNIPIWLNRNKFNVIFCVMDLNPTFNSLKYETGITVHGLLGSDFLESNKCILDYDRMILYHKL